MNVDMDRKACLRAAELVEQGHCNHVAARNALGISVLPTDETAESWCASGALAKAYAEINGEPIEWNIIRERLAPAASEARAVLLWKRLKSWSLPGGTIFHRRDRNKSQTFYAQDRRVAATNK